MIDVVVLLSCAVAFAATLGTFSLLSPARPEWTPPSPVGRGAWLRAAGDRFGRFVPENLVAQLRADYVPAGTPWGPPSKALLEGVLVATAGGTAACALVIGGITAGWVWALVIAGPAAVGGTMFPSRVLRAEIERRRNATAAGLPWLAALLALGFRSSGSLETVLRAYADVVKVPVLPRELGRVSADLRAGRTVDDALSALVERLPFEGTRALQRVLASYHALGGTEVADHLDALGERLRRQAVDVANAEAELATTRMVIPLTLSAISVVVALLAPFVASIGSALP